MIRAKSTFNWYSRPLLALGLAIAGASVDAQQNYARTANTVRAGTLLIESQRTSGVPSNYTPHVWFNLDQMKNVKPAGWTFSNPRANTFVTSEVFTRWTALGGAPPSVGTTGLGKRAASYWEIRLNEAGDDTLADYDILQLSGYGAISLSSYEREKLRRFIDQGGVLWVDLVGTSSLDQINGFPTPFDVFNAGNANRFADALHPLLSYPNTISPTNLASVELPAVQTGIRRFDLDVLGAGAIEGLIQPLEAESRGLRPIAGTNLGSTIAVAKVGDGYMLVTTRGAASVLNRVRNGGGYSANNAFFAQDVAPDRASEIAGKLVVNAVNLASGYSQAGAGSRKAGSIPVGIDAPLMKNFQADIDLTPGNAGSSYPPVLYKGLLVVSSQDRILVFDANPKTDLDGDGNPDDGTPDYASGTSMDLLWESETLSGPISPPLCLEASNADTGIPIDQVIVTNQAGRVYAFDAFQLVNGLIDPSPGPKAADYNVNSPSAPATGDGPFAPTYHEGMVFVSDSVNSGLSQSGRVWMFDPRAGKAVQSNGITFAVGGAGTQTFNAISSGATVGYIPITNGSGGLDRVVYLPTKMNTAGSGPSSHAGIASLWLGAKGESPIEWTSSAGTLQITTRAAVQGLNIYIPNGAAETSALGVRLTVITRATGEPWTRAQMAALFSGSPPGESGGILTYTLDNGGVLDHNLYDVRLDYTINWGTGIQSQTQQIFRGGVNLADNTNRTRQVIGQLALSPRGTIYAVMGDPADSGTPGGSFYALREEGRGTFRLLTRWDLYKEHTFTPNGGTTVTQRETILDNDPIQNFAPPFLGGKFGNLRFVGGPSVRRDTVFVTARGGKGSFGVPATVVLAFKAEPEVPEIRVTDLGEGAFSLVQPDMSRSANDTAPEVLSQLTSSQLKYEKPEGAGYGTIRIDNLMASNRGPITNSLSLSQPVMLRRQGQPDLLIEPDRQSSRWSPLLWYAVLHGYRSTTSPFIAGKNIYVAGSSGIPSVLSGGSPFATSAQIYALNTDIPSNDSFLVAPPERPWMKQAIGLKISGSGITTNPNFLWPQGTGVTSIQQYRTRLLQTVMPSSTVAYGVVGGEGMVVSWGNGGLYGFNRADFLVVDEGRVARYDASGNPIWSSDTVTTLGKDSDSGNAGNVRKLVRPVRAYRLGENDTLVVDAGANRIARLDSAGREIRSIDGFKVDPNFVPSGFEANESLKFREPRDASAFTSFQQNPARVSNPQPLEIWRHYLIADAGNRRLVEVVDRYAADPVTRQMLAPIELGLLYWHSPANLSGKDFDYSSVTRVLTAEGPVYLAGFGKSSPARSDIGLDTPGAADVRESRTGNGGIVVIGPSGVTQIVRSMGIPEMPANIRWNETTQSFNSPATPAHGQLIGSVSSLNAKYVTDGVTSGLAIMITDPSGVYELFGAPGESMDVRWMLTRDTYTKMRGLTLPFGGTGQPSGPGVPDSTNARGFLPTYARRLDSGEVLVVNAYQGQTRGNVQLDGSFTGRNFFSGEVIQLNGDLDLTSTNSEEGFGFGKVNFGFGIRSIRFELPPVTGTRTLLVPVFADRR